MRTQRCAGAVGAIGGGSGVGVGGASAGVVTRMRAAVVVAVVLAACGLLAEGSQGNVADGDGCGVGTAARACCGSGRFVADGWPAGEARLGIGPALRPAPCQDKCPEWTWSRVDGSWRAMRPEWRGPWERAAAIVSGGAIAGVRRGQPASSAFESRGPGHEGDAAVLGTRAATSCAGASSPTAAECSEARVVVREAA